MEGKKGSHDHIRLVLIFCTSITLALAVVFGALCYFQYKSHAGDAVKNEDTVCNFNSSINSKEREKRNVDESKWYPSSSTSRTRSSSSTSRPRSSSSTSRTRSSSSTSRTRSSSSTSRTRYRPSPTRSSSQRTRNRAMQGLLTSVARALQVAQKRSAKGSNFQSLDTPGYRPNIMRSEGRRRLPTALEPLHYDIEITPNIYSGRPESFNLDGYVRIKMRCLDPTARVTLHANRLTVRNVSLSSEGGCVYTPSRVNMEWNRNTQFLVIHRREKMEKDGIYYLTMNYSAPLGGNTNGLQLSRYGHGNKMSYVASTGFSSTASRAIFPCFDEPEIRSRFSLTVVRKNPVKSIFMMPLAGIQPRDNGWLADVYQTTPPLSTNQLSFTFGDMQSGGDVTNTTNVRLPYALYPVYYDIELRPNMYEGPPENFTFNGYVRILIHCEAPTNNVTLHTNKLDITDGTLAFWAVIGNAPSIVRWEWDKERQFMIIYLDGMLVRDNFYFLKMNYTGPLIEDLAGLYLSKYERNNQTVYLATTQLQPTDARKAFPCFDEPAIKSIFNVTLVRKNHLRSISNMPITRMENRGDNWVADVYQTTPIMSTYLLAFIVCDFDFKSDITKNNVLYRTWARPEAVDQTTYSLDVGVKVLTYFEDYFRIDYPLPKQDMVAVPDFAAGAMENWGLIIYRETAMLYDPTVSSEANKQIVAIVVAHELAHQWFGNLVTPSWWDDLWLNEGFASFVEYLGTDFAHPDWKMFEQFVYVDLQNVFDQDGLVTSHPLYVPVSNPDEINEIFDGISYAKGASVIRMMRFFLGERTFREGLSNYLQNNAYGSAFHDDLWFALSEQSKKDGTNLDVKRIMDTWTLQMNYPVVMVTRLRRNRIRVTQQRYLRDRNAVDPGKYKSDFGYKWDIPFVYTSSKEMKFNKTYNDIVWIRWVSNKTIIANKNIIPDNRYRNSWVLANPMQYGYYRVNYDNRNWIALVKQLKYDHKKIVPINRAQIINDALNLAKSDLMPMKIALQTFEYIDQELDYVPRAAANKELKFMDTMLITTDVYGAFKAFMKSKIQSPFKIVGMNDTGATHLESFIRSVIVRTACDYGIQTCIDESVRMYKQWMNNSLVNKIDPDLRDTVYCTAIKYGGVAEWDFAFRQYKTSPVAVESVRLLVAMGCSREPWILKRYMERALDPEQVRRQDALNVIIYVTRNPVGRTLAWDFFVTRWDDIRRDFGSGFFTFSRLIGELTASFNTPSDLARLQTFMDTHPDQGSGKRAFEQAVERTMANIRWIDTKLQIVKTWLTNLGFRAK